MKMASLAERVVTLVEEARRKTVAVVNLAMVYTYYEIGRLIVENEQHGQRRAKYGERLIEELSVRLTGKLGRGYSAQNLANMKQLYLIYSSPQIFQTPSRKSSVRGKPYTPQFTLSWSHYLKLMRIEDPAERSFYEVEARDNRWSLRELQRQFDASLYERLALSRDKNRLKELAKRGQIVERPEDAMKDPYVLEFTGIPERAAYSESDLEAQLISHIQEFMLELGKGFAFVGRQQRITFDERHFHVDLVFFNRLLKCFVLVDLKRGDLTHQDIGQMQMYVNYYDRVVKLQDENPTVGILLCHDKSDALVEYSLPEGNRQVFARQYRTILPSKERLKRLVRLTLDEHGESKK